MIEKEPTISAYVYHVESITFQQPDIAMLFAKTIAWLHSNPLFMVINVEVSGLQVTLHYLNSGEHYEAD